jgi:hypothetical protein
MVTQDLRMGRGHYPGCMMGSGADPGKNMGRFWTDSPGPRVSPAQDARLGRQLPAGAQINRAAKTISFTTTNVHFAVLASPAGRP